MIKASVAVFGNGGQHSVVTTKGVSAVNASAYSEARWVHSSVAFVFGIARTSLAVCSKVAPCRSFSSFIEQFQPHTSCSTCSHTTHAWIALLIFLYLCIVPEQFSDQHLRLYVDFLSGSQSSCSFPVNVGPCLQTSATAREIHSCIDKVCGHVWYSKACVFQCI